MSVIAFDTLKYVESLKKAGVDERQAIAMSEAQKEIFSEALDNRLATKADIAESQQSTKEVIAELKLDITEFKQEIKQDIAEIKQDITEFKQEIKQDIAQFKQETKQDIADLKQTMVEMHVAQESAIRKDLTDIMKWMFGGMVAVTGIFAAIVKLF